MHLGKVDIHGVGVSFFLLFPSVPVCGFFLSGAVLVFPYSFERFAHTQPIERGIFWELLSQPTSVVGIPSKSMIFLARAGGSPGFPEGMTGHFAVIVPFDFGYEGSVFGDVFVQGGPLSFSRFLIFTNAAASFVSVEEIKAFLNEPFFELVSP